MLKGKIYKLVSSQTDKIYIGSTTNYLSVRFSIHKYHYNRFINKTYNYISSFELMKYNDCKIELIQDFQCENRRDLLIKECEIVKQHSNCVNRQYKPRKSKKEYMKEYHYHYYLNNKDKKKQYYLQNKEKILNRYKSYYYNDNNKFIKQLMNLDLVYNF